MINVSNEFKQTMQTRTNFKEYAEITLVDGTVIKLDDTQFTVTNNSVTDGAALSAVPVGVAVQKIAQLEMLNDQEQWEGYDFFGARIRLYMTFALSNSTEKVERGLYTVTTPETYGETVIITAYDDMYKADKNYDTTLSFPATLKNMLIDICQRCSIPLLSTTFQHDDFTIPTKPDGQYTYRQIIGYIAMLAGGNARINNAGYLEIITYSGITSNAYYGNLDGIETGAPEHVLNAWQSLTMDKNDIEVTGVALQYDTQEGQAKLLEGTEGYVLTVYNPLVDVEDETALSTAVYYISTALVGLKFRKFDGVSVSNPLIEFMDFVAVKDRRGRMYQSFVTDITFTFLGSSTIKNSAESAVRTETVYAGNVNTEIRMRKLVEAERTARELAVSNLSNALANSNGLYETAEAQPDGSTIYYLHDKPTLAESKTVIKLTAEAIGVSTDGGKTYPYGFTVTGEMVTRLLATEGINADWIKTGALTITDDSGEVIFNADLDKKTVDMASARVTFDGKSFDSRFAESVTDLKIGTLNQIRNSRAMDNARYYLVGYGSTYALVGSAIVGQSTVHNTVGTVSFEETRTPDGGTDTSLKLQNCAGMAYRLVGISVEAGKPYTFSVRLKAAASMTVKVKLLGGTEKSSSVGTSWTTIKVTGTAQTNEVLISPSSNSALYLYQAMLQDGEVGTAWTPNTEEDAENVLALTKKYSEVQQDVEGIRTEVGRVEQEGKNTYATKTELTQTADSIKADVDNKASKSELSLTASNIRTEVTDQVSGAKSYTDQQVGNITLNVTDSSGGTTSITITADHKINLSGDVLANCITVAKLFAQDISVSGNFSINNGKYYMASDGKTLTISSGDGKGGTRITLDDWNVGIEARGKITLDPQSGGIEVNGSLFSDGISETGTKNEWSYQKYSDGTCDIWCSKSVSNVSCSTQAGTWWTSGNFGFNALPFSVTILDCRASWHSPSNYGIMMGRGYNTSATTAAPNFCLATPVGPASMSGTVSMYIHGKT